MTRPIIPLDLAPATEAVLGAPFASLTADLIKDHPPQKWLALQRAWQGRPHGFRLTTAGYQSAQLRMLPFLLQSANDRSKVFLSIHTKSGILHGSGATYWTALGTLTAALGMGKPPDHPKIQKYLETRALAEIPVRLSSTLEEVHLWMLRLPQYLEGALNPCFILGQRLSDFLQLVFDSLAILRTTTEAFLAVTFFVGKTIGSTGPYTLHLPLNSEAATLLISSATQAKKKGWTNLFFPPGETWEATRAIISATINRDVRCIRRGGLQRMALAGIPQTSILIFSRHATPAMLSRYLQHNLVLLDQARITAACVALSECAVVSGHIESL